MHPPSWRRLTSCWHDVGPWRFHSRQLSHRAPAGARWVVLVHGLGVSGRYMAPLALELADRFRVAITDLPGHGRTHPRGRHLGVSDMAVALAAWMHVAGVGGAHLVGNSLGCQVALQVAADGRVPVSRLLLVGPTMDPAAQGPIRQVGRLLRGVPREPVSLSLLALGEQLYRPTQAWHALQAALAHPVGAVAHEVANPTVLVRGAADHVAPTDWLRQLSTWLRDAEVVELPVGAHGVHYAHPRRVAPLLRR
jgi:2-hydroxy-6-oxonona-2,4-dienedioate hydrolase